MPRKNAKPAARKRQRALKTKLQKLEQFDHRVRPYLANPRLGDGMILAAIAAACLAPNKY